MEIQRKKNYAKRLMSKDDSIFMEYIENTSANGVSKMFTKQYSVPRRLFWLVIILGATAACLYTIIDRIIFLASGPTSTTSTITRTRPLEFPAVTICNINFFAAGSLEAFGLLEAGVHGLNPLGSTDCDTSIGSNPLAKEVVLDDLSSKNLSRSLSDFILGCFFLDDLCDMEHDFKFSSLGFGACYTFNGYSKMPPLEINGAGSHHGLFLLLNINQSEYTSSALLDAGVRIFIHRSSEPAQILGQGISVPPGRAAFIGLRQETIVNQAGVDCVTNYDNSQFNFLGNNFNYSASACLIDCQITTVANVCGCYHFSSDLRPSNPIYANISNCTFSDICCIQEVLSSVLNCTCPSSCVTTFYDSSTSYSSMPAEYVHKYFSDFDILDIDKNFVEVLIYFQTDIVETETTTFSYDFVALISDIGGQLGLFLGISVITVVEFFIWLLDEGLDRMCCFKISWKRGGRKGTI